MTIKIVYLGIEGLDPEILFEDDLFSEKLLHFHQLMDMGSYGELEILDKQPGEYLSSLAELPEWGGNQRIIRSNEAVKIGEGDWNSFIHETIAQSARHFDEAIRILISDDWDYLEYIDMGLANIYTGWQSIETAESSGPELKAGVSSAIREYYLHLEEQLGRLFENIAGELIFCIVSRPATTSKESGFFILAAPDNPLQGELVGVRLLDLGPTLLELGGFTLPEAMVGNSLVQGYEKPASSEGLSQEEEELLRERLSGLGYIS